MKYVFALALLLLLGCDSGTDYDGPDLEGTWSGRMYSGDRPDLPGAGVIFHMDQQGDRLSGEAIIGTDAGASYGCDLRGEIEGDDGLAIDCYAGSAALMRMWFDITSERTLEGTAQTTILPYGDSWIDLTRE